MSTNNYIPMRETFTKIGGTTYVVKAFANPAARETLEQKLERILLRNADHAVLNVKDSFAVA